MTMLAGSSLEPSLPRLELASLRLEQAELKQGGLDLSEGDGDGGRGGVEAHRSAWLETELGGWPRAGGCCWDTSAIQDVEDGIEVKSRIEPERSRYTALAGRRLGLYLGGSLNGTETVGDEHVCIEKQLREALHESARANLSRRPFLYTDAFYKSCSTLATTICF